ACAASTPPLLSGEPPPRQLAVPRVDGRELHPPPLLERLLAFADAFEREGQLGAQLGIGVVRVERPAEQADRAPVLAAGERRPSGEREVAGRPPRALLADAPQGGAGVVGPVEAEQRLRQVEEVVRVRGLEVRLVALHRRERRERPASAVRLGEGRQVRAVLGVARAQRLVAAREQRRVGRGVPPEERAETLEDGRGQGGEIVTLELRSRAREERRVPRLALPLDERVGVGGGKQAALTDLARRLRARARGEVQVEERPGRPAEPARRGRIVVEGGYGITCPPGQLSE